MKNIFRITAVCALLCIFYACNNDTEKSDTTAAAQDVKTEGGQETVQDDVSQKDIVKTAIGSKDHTNLVAALQQAEYVNDLSNAGPFTVFAPTNAAFDKLPAGTLDGLMKNEKKADLQNILEYHVAVGVYKTEAMRDGQKINMANLSDITVNIKNGKVQINGTANVLASVPASNGIIHVVDAVLLPPEKKQ